MATNTQVETVSTGADKAKLAAAVVLLVAAVTVYYLLGKQDLFVRALTEKMMSFALGREVDYYDMPAVRTILHDAASQQNRFSAIVMGIVASDAFMMRTVAPRADSVLTTAVESAASLGR